MPQTPLTDQQMLDRMQAALDWGGGAYTIADIHAALARGEMLAFHNNQAIIVAEVLIAPRKRVLHCVLAAGALPDVLALVPDVTAAARALDADYLQIVGRQGWQRILSRHGWGSASVVMRKELS